MAQVPDQPTRAEDAPETLVSVDLAAEYEASGIGEVLDALERDLVGLAPVKRRVREVFRRCSARLPGGWDILVNPRVPVATMPFPTLERELGRLFPNQPPPAKRPEGV